MYVIKRDGRKVDFNSIKITNAIRKSSLDLDSELNETELSNLTNDVIEKINSRNILEIEVEEIQNIVEEVLMKNDYIKIGKSYSNYRNERNRVREIKSDLMKAINKIGIETDRDNGAKRFYFNV